MKTAFIATDSFTSAGRARRYLQSLKIKSRVEKISGRNGCTFGIRVYEDAEKICRLLSNVNIACKKIVYDD